MVLQLPAVLHSAAHAAALEPVDWSDPAAQAAWHRKVGHARAIELLVAGQPGRAHAEVMRTYLRQVRVLGLSYAGIPGRPYDEMGPLP
jgi:hypothetical protein